MGQRLLFYVLRKVSIFHNTAVEHGQNRSQCDPRSHSLFKESITSMKVANFLLSQLQRNLE